MTPLNLHNIHIPSVMTSIIAQLRHHQYLQI